MLGRRPLTPNNGRDAAVPRTVEMCENPTWSLKSAHNDERESTLKVGA